MMKWTENLWVRLHSLGFVMFVAVLLGGVTLVFLPQLQRRHALQQELRRLDEKIAVEENRERRLQAEIDALKSDPVYVERVARQKLNLVRPNETIFRFSPRPDR
jgi:cell division protein FtsB